MPDAVVATDQLADSSAGCGTTGHPLTQLQPSSIVRWPNESDSSRTPTSDHGDGGNRRRSRSAAFWSLRHMEVDIFPSLNLPVIYVAQPYGGMDPAQMEGLLTNYYEYHFLYISGIHHVESKNVQGVALMKLFFHPGTNMAQAMAETINYVNRSRAFMPPGTVSPFVMRFDTGSVPVGYLVLVERDADAGRDSGPGAVPRAADVRHVAGRFGAAAVRRQSADDRRSTSIRIGCGPTTFRRRT